jgi:protein-L-isoaspartate(D-aspartate) O-methyltransferase
MILLCRLIEVRPSVRHTARRAGRYMVAIMNEALELRLGNRVLEVGAGSGYHAATVAEQIGPQGRVYTIELVPDLVKVARSNLEKAGYFDRVTLVQGDGSLGYPDRAPYDRIVVTAAAPKIPQPLVVQLKPGGILVIPVGGRLFPQELVRVRKDENGRVERASLGGVAFVPLIGKEGYDS